MKVDFLDLTIQDKKIQNAIFKSIKEIVRRGDFILGKEVTKLEEEFKKYFKVKHAILVGSCTDALLLSLKALNFPENSEVITTPFTFFATSEAIINAGLKPVYVDIDPKTFNIDAHSIEKCITKNTRAILPVHIFGQSCQIDKIIDITKKYNLEIIEDCAQSFGAKFNGEHTGTFGKCGCFSFYPTKNLGAYGDAGLVITNDTSLAKKINILRNHGTTSPYKHSYLGLNSRCDTFQAAVLLNKLPYLKIFNKIRRKNAQRYFNNLESLKDVELPYVSSNCYHIYHQFSIKVKRRNELKKYLLKNKINTNIYYETPLNEQNIISALGFSMNIKTKHSNIVSENILSLPISPSTRLEEIDYICQTIERFYNGRI